MTDYKIITDSNCDFTPALIEELDIQVIPMEFVMGEKVYRNYPDERDMSAKEFYSRIRAGDVVSCDLTKGEIRNETTGETFQAQPFPPFIQRIIDAGGLLKSL